MSSIIDTHRTWRTKGCLQWTDKVLMENLFGSIWGNGGVDKKNSPRKTSCLQKNPISNFLALQKLQVKYFIHQIYYF